MRYAKSSLEKDCSSPKSSFQFSAIGMTQEQLDRPSKQIYSGNRSYAFDDLVNLFENMSTQKSLDDSVFTEKIVSSTLKNASINYPLDTTSSLLLKNSINGKSTDNNNQNEVSLSIGNGVNPITTNQNETQIFSAFKSTRNHFKIIRNSLKGLFKKPKVNGSKLNSIEESNSLYLYPKKQRKLAVKQKLKACLQGLKPYVELKEDQQFENIDDAVFKDRNKETSNVCGINFDVYKFSPGKVFDDTKIIITLHDIVHNSKSNFEKLFSDPRLIDWLKNENYTVWHICLPGHGVTENCIKINNYPGFVELSKMITILITDNLQIKSCVGIGVGAGADLLIRSSLVAPQLYTHLVCVNINLRSTDGAKVVNYPLIFNPINSHLKNFGVDYFESNCIKQFSATSLNIESLRKYKQFLNIIQKNPNIAQLTLRYWRRPDIYYYIEEIFRRLESIPKILIQPNVLLIEGLTNPEINTKGDILDFIFPSRRIYKGFENGSKLVLDEYTTQIAELVPKFIKDSPLNCTIPTSFSEL